MSVPAHRVKAVPGDVFRRSQLMAWVLMQTNAADLGDRPFYLLKDNADVRAISTHEGNNYIAYTGPKLSEDFEVYLRVNDVWAGPGCCVVFHTERFRQSIEAGVDESDAGLGILIHEAAHYVEIYRQNRSSLSTFGIGAKRHHRKKAVQDLQGSAYIFGDSHGPQFVRAALHLRHRVASVRQVSLDSLIIAGDRYGMSPARHYQLALGKELEEKRHTPVSQVLLSKPPRMFNQLWLEDMENMKRRRSAVA